MPFFEFRWAYFFNDAAFSSFLWDNQTAFSRFKAIFPAALSDPSDNDKWRALAVPMVYLARGTAAAQYRVPGSMGTLAGALPGWLKPASWRADRPEITPPAGIRGHAEAVGPPPGRLFRHVLCRLRNQDG